MYFPFFAAKMSDVLKCKQTTVIKMRTGGGGAETKISTDLKSGQLTLNPITELSIAHNDLELVP